MKDIKILEKAIKTFKKNQKRNYPAETSILIDKLEISAIENLINRVKELERYKRKHTLIKSNYIPKSKIKEILGIEEQDKIDILDYLKTIVDEFNRLEDIEDKKVQIEYEKVFNKGVKSVENKIKRIIEELREDIQYSANPLSIDNSKYAIKILQELLEE